MKSYILVVEDNEEDFEALQRAFIKCGINQHVLRFADGLEAMNYLAALEEAQQHNRYPVVVLLDLNLPNLDGRSFLDWIKGRSELKKIPVLVLTTSNDLQDINECYSRGANSYICKPQQFDEFLSVVQRVKQFWLEVSVLPFKTEDIA